jgi:hypothetical protein
MQLAPIATKLSNQLITWTKTFLQSFFLIEVLNFLGDQVMFLKIVDHF